MIFLGVFLLLSLIFWLIFGRICFVGAHGRRKSRIIERNDLCGGGGRALPSGTLEFVRGCRYRLDEMSSEIVYITSDDGLRLCGRLIEHTEARGLVIFAHGYHSSCRRDLAVQIKAVYDAGFSVLTIYQRAHGLSEGKYITFGIKERYDVLRWSEYAAARYPDLPIALFGLSMGGATVMMTSDLPLPRSVRCVISDCGFTSPREIISNTLRYKRKIIVYPTIWFMEFWAHILAKFRYRDASAIDALSSSRLPVLIIHGEEDRYVPTEMSLRNAEAAGERAELFTVPVAKHGQSVYFDPDGYCQRVRDFLEKHIGDGALLVRSESTAI